MLLTNELCSLYVWLRVHCVKVCALLSLICVRGEKQLFFMGCQSAMVQI